MKVACVHEDMIPLMKRVTLKEVCVRRQLLQKMLIYTLNTPRRAYSFNVYFSLDTKFLLTAAPRSQLSVSLDNQ